jgi:hypothetical protein
MSDQPTTEVEALRAYFDAHMNMQHANTEEAFGRFYVKANLARDRLIQIEQERAEPQGAQQ